VGRKGFLAKEERKHSRKIEKEEKEKRLENRKTGKRTKTSVTLS
jgi:hypothetical protein